MSTDIQTLRVAVVDDEPGIRLGVEAILSDFGVELPDIGITVKVAVESWPDGESFLESARQNPPQVVLLDSKLPGIGGMEILEGTLCRLPDVVTVMITAYATLESAVRATKLGAYDFLAKPFTPEELRVTLRKAIHHHQLSAQARRLMEEKRQVRFQFISVLAHELKSPINAVDGYLDIMRNRMLGESIDAYTAMIERSSLRIAGMRKLINDLLDLTRVESGQRQRCMESVDLAQTAKGAMEAQESLARSMDVHMELCACENAVMTADRVEMEMIFNNLVSNAVKYNRTGGRVTVRIDRRESGMRVEVEDTGWGMRPEDAARLFADFVRIKNEHTRDIPGSGLGLSLVKKLVGLYDGQISVESQPEVGTKFIVDFSTPQPLTQNGQD